MSWSRASRLQRASRRDGPHGDGCHSIQRGDLGPYPRVSPVEAGAHIPPTAALEMPKSQSRQRLNKLVTTTYALACSITCVSPPDDTVDDCDCCRVRGSLLDDPGTWIVSSIRVKKRLLRQNRRKITSLVCTQFFAGKHQKTRLPSQIFLSPG